MARTKTDHFIDVVVVVSNPQESFNVVVFCDRFGPFGRCPDGIVSCGKFISGKPLLYIEGREGI